MMDKKNKAPWLDSALGAAGIGSALGGMFGQGFGGDYMKSANPYFQQMPSYLKQYLDPYINAGQGAMGQLQGQYSSLMNDPSELMNKIGSSYQQSPGYQYNIDQATRGSHNAAAAGGMLGSPQEQAELAKTYSGIANQDYGNYMNNALGLFGQGMQGMQGINQMGYGASTNMAGSLMDMLKNQASLSYANQANKNQSQGGMFSGLGGLGGLASLGMFL